MDDNASYQGRLDGLASDLDRLGKRLRSLTRNSWGPRRSSVLALVAQLADLSAAAEQRPPQPVPALPEHSLSDAVSVIGSDLVSALSAAPSLDLLVTAEQAVKLASESTR